MLNTKDKLHTKFAQLQALILNTSNIHILHCNMTLIIYQQQKDGNIQQNGVCFYVPRVTFFEGELNLCWGTGEEQHLVAQTMIVRWVRLDPRAEISVPSSWHTSNSSVEIAHFVRNSVHISIAEIKSNFHILLYSVSITETQQ